MVTLLFQPVKGYKSAESEYPGDLDEQIGLREPGPDLSASCSDSQHGSLRGLNVLVHIEGLGEQGHIGSNEFLFMDLLVAKKPRLFFTVNWVPGE